MKLQARPLLIVVSAPSGAGKSTLCDRLLAMREDIVYSVSCTTRKPRGAEQHGRDYYFLSEATFLGKLSDHAFLEHATVHNNRYGTLRQTAVDSMAAGKSVLMDIDVQGADQVREYVRQAPEDDPVRRGFIDVFINPPSLQILRERLEGRGEDAADVIERRMAAAEAEMSRASDYQYVIVNDDLERASEAFHSIVERESRKP